MKPASGKIDQPRASDSSSMANVIASSLRDARRDAVKTARMHRTPLVYLRDGKIISDRPAKPKN